MGNTIGFIGAGNMGGAIIKGIIKSKAANAADIIVYDKNIDILKTFEADYGIKAADGIKAVCEADILFLAVKPNVLYSVIAQIRDFIDTDKTIVVSIAAGQSIWRLTREFNYDTIKLVRAMPNTPALVGEGMTAVSFNEQMREDKNREKADYIMSLFASFGKVELVPESIMNAVTGVSGSSPAYIFMLIEAMADAAVLGGMPRKQAYTFAAQSVLGSAKMVLEMDKHPGELKDMVCSPGGTTIEAVKVLENESFRGTVMNAIDACIKKSEAMDN